MDTGMRIKYNRLKKKMSVEELASGILLPKELKKIESGLKEPALDELQALCKKLGISLAPKDNPVGRVLVKNFKTSLLHPKNKAKIMELYADIHNHPLLFVDEDIELEYRIQQIRYCIITGDLDNAELYIKEIDRYTEFMSQEQFYLFHKYIGNYNYTLRDFDEALKTYLFAEKITPPTVSSIELADLYYSIGLSASLKLKMRQGKKYAEMALRIYQQEFIPKRIVECHLTIAINEKRSGNFMKAKEHFKHALTIGSKLDHEPLKFDTEYNYGNFYFQFQNFELAIEHLESAMQYKPYEYTSDILMGYSLMIKCYIELGNLDEATKLVDKGYNIIKEKNISLSTPSNDSFKEVYVEFMCLYHFLKNDLEKFEEELSDMLLPILEAHHKNFEIGFYFTLLGNTYINKNEFLKAAKIFKQSAIAFRNTIIVNEE